MRNRCGSLGAVFIYNINIVASGRSNGGPGPPYSPKSLMNKFMLMTSEHYFTQDINLNFKKHMKGTSSNKINV